MVVNQFMYYSLMLQRHSIKWRLMYYYNKLRDRSMCQRINKLLYYMYTSQSCCVKWSTEYSDNFNVSNGVKQGGVLSPLLLSCYIDKLFSLLQNSGVDCHVWTSYAGSFGYAEVTDMFRIAIGKVYHKLRNNLLPPYFNYMKPNLPVIYNHYNVRNSKFHPQVIKYEYMA